MKAIRRVLRGRVVLAAAVLTLMGASAALGQQNLPGNFFNQNGVAPLGPNISIAVNNANDGGGGGWSGGTNNTNPYPIGDGNSPVANENIANFYSSAQYFAGTSCNVAFAQGYYTDTSGNTFVNSPFGAIDTIRIWAQSYLNSAGPPPVWWAAFPTQVEVGYTTSPINLGNAYGMDSATGTLPGNFPNVATILSVNGVGALAPSNATYGAGWADLTGSFTNGYTQIGNNPAQNAAYVDLTVAVPAGATGICFAFGEDDSSTGNQGGLFISSIQATLHPTWSNAAATGVWDSSTLNWSSAAGATVAYSDGLPVVFDDTGGGGTVTIQGSGSPSQVKPYSVTFNNNATNYTLTGDPIGGAATLTQTGSGTVTLANANTFTGTTSANNGTLNLSNSNALQNSTLAMGGGNVVFDQSVTGHAFTLGGLSGSGNLALQDNATPTPNAVALTVGGNNASTVYSGVLSGPGSLTKTGSGVLLVTSSNSYGGPTTITGGTVKLQGQAAYQYYEFSVTGAQGGSIMQMSELAFYSSGDNPSNGTRVIPSGGISANNGTWNSGEGPTNLDNNTLILGTYSGKYCDLYTPTPSAPQYVTFNFGSPISLSGYDWATADDSVPGRNPNNWTVLGSNNGTTWTTLDTETNAGQNPSTATYTYAGGWSLSLPSGNGSLPSGTTLQLAGGATLDLGGVSQTVASLSDYNGSGGTVTNSGAVAATLTVAGPTSTTFSGSIQDGASQIALSLSGGTLVLNGSDTYTGGTDVEGGMLDVASSSAIPYGSGLTVGTNGTVVFGASGGGAYLAQGASLAVSPAGVVAAVPEPGTLALLLVGAAGALLTGWRSRNSRRD